MYQAAHLGRKGPAQRQCLGTFGEHNVRLLGPHPRNVALPVLPHTVVVGGGGNLVPLAAHPLLDVGGRSQQIAGCIVGVGWLAAGRIAVSVVSDQAQAINAGLGLARGLPLAVNLLTPLNQDLARERIKA